MALLDVKHLSVQLQTRQGPATAVRDLSFTLRRGETLGLVGESGCGKSLTALALMGLLPDHAQVSGSIRFDQQELVGLADTQLQDLRGNRVGMVFQEPMTALNPVQTIGQQVAEPLRLHRRLAAAPARRQAVALLERVGIADAARRVDAYPHQFSGGQRQRITIAMALACEPDLLIADEPTTALDVTLQAQILDLIADLVQERGMALLLISHDLGVIAQNAQRMLVMYGGSVMESGPTDSVFAQRVHPYTRGLFNARPQLGTPRGQRLHTIPGQVPELLQLPAGCPFHDRCAWAEPACTQTRPTLRDWGTTPNQHQASCLRQDQLPPQP
jgi:peptide/nickel transport system ATP-binding protein